jgi:hypothetical protein
LRPVCLLQTKTQTGTISGFQLQENNAIFMPAQIGARSFLGKRVPWQKNNPPEHRKGFLA